MNSLEGPGKVSGCEREATAGSAGRAPGHRQEHDRGPRGKGAAPRGAFE